MYIYLKFILIEYIITWIMSLWILIHLVINNNNKNQYGQLLVLSNLQDMILFNYNNEFKIII